MLISFKNVTDTFAKWKFSLADNLSNPTPAVDIPRAYSSLILNVPQFQMCNSSVQDSSE